MIVATNIALIHSGYNKHHCVISLKKATLPIENHPPMRLAFLFQSGIILLLFCTAGCTQKYIYRPITARPHFFQGKGDHEIHLNASGNGEFGGSYALLNFLAAGITYTSGQVSTSEQPVLNELGNPTGVTQIDQRIHRDLEGNVTLFRPITENIIIEATVGFSAPSESLIQIREGENGERLSRSVLSSNNIYSRGYIQPAIGRNGKLLDAGFALRIQAINYAGGVQNDILVEPVVMVRTGYNRWKAMLQIGATYDYKNSTLANDYDYFPLHIGLGLNYVVTPQTGRKNK